MLFWWHSFTKIRNSRLTEIVTTGKQNQNHIKIYITKKVCIYIYSCDIHTIQVENIYTYQPLGYFTFNNELSFPSLLPDASPRRQLPLLHLRRRSNGGAGSRHFASHVGNNEAALLCGSTNEFNSRKRAQLIGRITRNIDHVLRTGIGRWKQKRRSHGRERERDELKLAINKGAEDCLVQEIMRGIRSGMLFLEGFRIMLRCIYRSNKRVACGGGGREGLFGILFDGIPLCKKTGLLRYNYPTILQN